MKRILIEVAYDGTSYCGWQIQPNGMTVEEKLNQVLSRFLSEEIRVIGASRTDSGVHALGNVAVFDTETGIPPEKICYALNSKLPGDIRIRSSRQVPSDFHPRFCRSVKTYEYHIQNVRIPIPTERLYTCLVTYPLHVDRMREGAGILVGKHDFQSFCASGTSAKTTVRTVRSLDIDVIPYRTDDHFSAEDQYQASNQGQTRDQGQAGDPDQASNQGQPGDPDQTWRKDIRIGETGDRKIIIRISGEGFLYNMVRIIAGTLIKVGLQVYPPEHVREILQARDRNMAGETAPAKGLFLKKINFIS